MKGVWIMGVSLAILGATGVTSGRPDDGEPEHLRAARELVRNLDLKDTRYEHGRPDVRFERPCRVHADCSGFLTALLQHSYALTPEGFGKWFGHERPTADRYHDAVVRRERFEPVPDFRRVRPGDVLAVKYTPPQDRNTGHVMLAAGTPRAVTAAAPVRAGTRQWEVAVIDCSRSGHGPTDTRHGAGEGGKDHDGLGQGVLRVYTDDAGRVAGYTWSPGGKTFLSPPAHDLVVGRLKAPGNH
ncbi:MAG TPA: hypothetical protein VH092_16035 [Urbifossiella sp.]|nr:hypothetical protein [Urbifossiella sp.]